jgi:hypothetical protein
MSTAELLHARQDLIAEYATVTGAGKKAGIARKLGQVELDLVLSGAIPGTEDQVKDKSHPATFTPWENPTAARVTRTAISEEEIRTGLAETFAVYSNGDMPDTIRAAADVRLNTLLRQAEVRGYKLPDPRRPAPKAEMPKAA